MAYESDYVSKLNMNNFGISVTDPFIWNSGTNVMPSNCASVISNIHQTAVLFLKTANIAATQVLIFKILSVRY